ncbi:MAG TPA: hypothetical protein VFS81_17630 [Candidatus Binatia bacterium]|nr:hypothetical protein [Candidatus Binatia bacterium]
MFRGVLGILIGAGIYSEVYPLIENNLLKLGDYGKLTLPTVLDIDPWFVIVPFTIVVSGILLLMDQIDKRKTTNARELTR